MRSGTRYLLLAFLAGAAVRLLFLGSRSFWHDEALSLLIAGRPSFAEVWRLASPLQFGAPAYFLALHGWLALGHGESAVRLLSVAGSLAALAATFALARAWLSPASLLAGVWLAALLPFSIEYAQEARTYAWLSAFELAAALAVARGLARPGGRWTAAFAAALFLASATHPAAWIWWTGIFAGLALTPEGRRLLPRGAAASVPAALVTGLGFLASRAVWRDRLADAFRLPSATEYLRQTALLFTAGHAPGVWAEAVLPFAVPVLAGVGVWAIAREPRRRPAAAVLAALTVVPVGLVWFGIAAGASTQLRYVAAVPPVLALVLAAGAGALPRWARAAALLLLLGAQADAFRRGLKGPPSLEPTFCLLSKKPVREATWFVRAGFRPGDRIVHVSTAALLPMRWYAPDLPQGYLIDNPDLTPAVSRPLVGPPAPLERQLEGARRIWLVSCPWRFRDAPVVPGDLASVLGRRCGTPQVRSFGGLDVYLAVVKGK